MRQLVCVVALALASGGVLPAQRGGFVPDDPAPPAKPSEVYDTVAVWVAEVVPGLSGRTRQLGVFGSKAEADAAAARWDAANDARGKDKELATTNVREGTMRVPLKRNSGSDNSTPPGKIEIAPPRPLVDPGAMKKPAAPDLKGKKVPGEIGDLKVTFEFAAGGTLSITGDATGSGKWKQDGSSLSMETQVATYRGNMTADGAAGLRFWKDGTKPLTEWRFSLATGPKSAVAKSVWVSRKNSGRDVSESVIVFGETEYTEYNHSYAGATVDDKPWERYNGASYANLDRHARKLFVGTWTNNAEGRIEVTGKYPGLPEAKTYMKVLNVENGKLQNWPTPNSYWGTYDRLPEATASKILKP